MEFSDIVTILGKKCPSQSGSLLTTIGKNKDHKNRDHRRMLRSWRVEKGSIVIAMKRITTPKIEFWKIAKSWIGPSWFGQILVHTNYVFCHAKFDAPNSMKAQKLEFDVSLTLNLIKCNNTNKQIKIIKIPLKIPKKYDDASPRSKSPLESKSKHLKYNQKNWTQNISQSQFYYF